MVIASKSFSQVFNTFNYSKVFVKEIALFSIFFGIIFYFLFHIPTNNLFILIIAIIILDVLILYSIGQKRKRELNEIKELIKAIRKNKIKDESEIILSEPLRNLEGNIKAMFKRTQDDLKHMEKLAHARTEFLGYVSHELRTPIFAIQGFLETLLNGAVDDPKVNKTFLQKAINHSENLNTLLNDLINISMIESGMMKLSFRIFNLYDFLNQIIFEVQENKKDDVELILSDFSRDLHIYADKDKLQQVMDNLISNALKYTDEGKVEVIVKEKNRFVEITVKDTGIGIPQHELNRIFERFYRTERERESAVPGTGLGLSIVKHILEAHNSSIRVNSKLNQGSEFTFNLRKG